MSYRRPSNADVFSSRWRIAHRAELMDCRLPSEVLQTDRRWMYVLFHGDDLETGWDASWLSEQQARKLLAVLEPHCSDMIGTDLVNILRRRFSRSKQG